MPPPPPTPALHPLASAVRQAILNDQTTLQTALRTLSDGLVSRAAALSDKEKLLAVHRAITELSRAAEGLRDKARELTVLAGDADKTA